MRKSTDGLRRNTMENKDALEYFLAILDEAECVLKGDSFRECSEIVEYSLKEKEAPKSKICPVDDEVSSCHDCALFRNRRIYECAAYQYQGRCGSSS